jgi:hypothetical protein
MANHPALTADTRRIIISRIEFYDELNEEQQAVSAIKIIAQDFYIFCERNLMIKEKMTKQLVPFASVLNWEQRGLLEKVIDCLRKGQPVRFIVLKARQMGISTLIEALCYWWTSTHRYVTSVIIAHEKNAVGTLYKMFRRYYEYSHPHFQPDRKYNTKNELTFDVDDTVKKEYAERGETPPGLQSEIKTMVAADGKGRADNINFFHGSEVAFWDDSADIVSSALQAVPMAPESFVFLESTANGIGGYFYDEWQLAKRGESQFTPLFFAWWEHDGYELPATDDDIGHLDDEETNLYELFEEADIPREQWPRKIAWRRRKKLEFRTDPKKFYQEYPSTPEEAFLASGRPVFDTKMLQKFEKIALDNAKKFPYRCGEIIANPDTSSLHKFIFHELRRVGEYDPTPLRVWWLPEKDAKYVIGVDVSEGIEIESSKGREPDFSVIDVMDAKTRKTVARWRGYIDPDKLGEVVFAIGKFYNNALVGVEVNNHGIATAAHLKNHFYRNLYMRESAEDDQFQVRTTKFGWVTNKKTKPIMISELQRSIREGDIIDLDIVFIREAMSYVKRDDGSMAAQEGQHDDCVMAKAVALQMADWSPYDTAYARENIQKPIKRHKNATTSTPSLNSPERGTSPRASNREAVQRRREQRKAHRSIARRGSTDS